MAEAQERTEDPTGKREGEFKKRGDIPKSPELSFALSFMAGLCLLGTFLPQMAGKLASFWRDIFAMMARPETDPWTVLTSASIVFLSATGPFLGASAGLALVFGAVPSGIPMVELKLDFSRLDPVGGFGRLWKPEMAVELLKSFLKLGVIGWALWAEMRNDWEGLLAMTAYSPADIAGGMLKALSGLAWKAAVISLAFGALDLVYKTRLLKKRMKMTKEEVKEERKQLDGNPLIKGKIKAMMRQMSRRTRLAAVAQASVVVVNPTHFAVALKYERGKMLSPEVVAKGMDLMALKIIEVARENKVPVHQNIPLARALYPIVQPGQPIPPAFYKAVAEVFAWVYAEKRRWKNRR